MTKVISYLKSSLGSIILVIIFLIIQAICDLSLPDYTSRIVNVGIQQGGIESAVPEVMRESTFFKIRLFTKENDKKVLDKGYKRISKESLDNDTFEEYLKKYPSLINDPLYIKDNIVNENEIENIIKNSVLSVTALEDNNDFQNIIKETLIKQGIINSDNNKDIFAIIASLPTPIADKIIDSIESKIINIPDSIKLQSAIGLLKMEYIACGTNIDNMQINYILHAGGKMLGLAFLSMVSIVTVVFLASRIAAKLGHNLRNDVYVKVLYFSDAEFDKFKTASLITRTTNDIIQVQTLLVLLLRMVFYAPILGVGGFIKVLETNRSMTWIIGIALLAIIVVVGALFYLAMPRFKIVQNIIDKLNGVSREILSGLPVIRAFANEERELKRFDESNKELTKVNLFVNRTMIVMMPAMMFIMNGITILIVYVGKGSISDGIMQVGDLMAFIQYSIQIVMAFLIISMVSVVLPRALVCAKRIGEVLNTENSIKNPERPQNLLISRKGTIEFKDVSFKYPDSEKMCLSNISFTAKRNKVTAIIGSTGSGKSTLIKLIPRLFDVSSGDVFVDGINVKSADLHQLRSKIGFVPQKAVLFSGTILENIICGNEKILAYEAKEAAEIAQCKDFIQAKENKYDEYISQGGSNVSGGQKQRISIARAIAKKPEILIFDDSFSALDYKTDVMLRKALKTKIKDCTYIIVAQRITSVKDADNIIVLDKGRIVGNGTHTELMESCSEYKQIAYSQLSKEELG